MLPVGRRYDRNPNVYILVVDPHLDPPVLGESLLGHVETGHDLYSGDNRVLRPLRRGISVVEEPVDPVADPQVFFERLDVDVACPVFYGNGKEQVDQLYDGRLVRRVVEEVVPARYFLSDLGEGAFSQVLHNAYHHFPSLFFPERVQAFEEFLFRNAPLFERHIDEDAQRIGARRVFLPVDSHHEGRGLALDAERDDPVFLKERVMYPGYAVRDRLQLFFTRRRRFHYFVPCGVSSFSCWAFFSSLIFWSVWGS